MNQSWLRRQFLWIVPLLVTVASLVLALLLAGAKGAGIADALSLLVGSAALVVALLTFLHSLRDPSPPPPPLSPTTRRLIAAVVATALGTGGAVLYFQVVRKPDVPVTDLVEVSLGKGMSNGARAELAVPGAPPSRSFLALVPRLENTKAVGDCVGSAELDITVVRDGLRQEPTTGHRSGVEVTIDLSGTTREARILLTLHVVDSDCRVDLALTEAVLFN